MTDTFHAGVCVVGAGPAGIAATVAAAEAGADVLLVDEGIAPGGQIWRHGQGASAPPLARRWLERLARTGARRVSGAAIWSPSKNVLRLETPSGAAEVSFEAIVLATGARELFLPFPGWTLPGVVGVGAAQALVKSGASMRGRRAIVAGSGPLLLAAAAALSAAGAVVRTIAEQAPAGRIRAFARRLATHPGKLLEAARYRAKTLSARYRPGTWVSEGHGQDHVLEAVLTDGKNRWTEPCDLLCSGYGLVPNVELARHLGCAVESGRMVVDHAQRSTVPGVFGAGEVTGIGGVEVALAEGRIAGESATGRGGTDRRAAAARRARLRFESALAAAFEPRPEVLGLCDPRTIVCRCEDVRWGALETSWTGRQAKLYTRVGMGPCQGKVCGPALGLLLGWDSDSVRPPLRPAAMSSLVSMGEAGDRETEKRGGR